MVTIYSVKEGSTAAKHGILPGDIIISINGHEIRDVLDYRFYLTEKSIELKIHRGPELFDVKIRRSDPYADIGIDFETFLMDKKQRCKNGCVFCFIDQLPQGMRDTLYFKDDDSRLSFLMGNYITLTNLNDKDIDRIIEMHMSPINISVHTTNPELRIKMMKNKNAGESLRFIKKLSDAGILINAQIVLCRGLNDGNELDRTMRDLAEFYPQLQSVSVVPCGLTKYRSENGLYPLEPFTPEETADVIARVNNFSEKCLKKHGSRIFFCGDEMYIKSGVPLPAPEYYEGYPQIENGVGMIPSMQEEFDAELEFIDEYDLELPRSISVATGVAAYNFIESLIAKLKNVCYNLNCNVFKIRNDFFGENITVAGLVTARDIIAQLRGKELGDVLYLPQVMLRSEGDMFLDSVTVDELSVELGVHIEFIPNDGAEFIRRILK